MRYIGNKTRLLDFLRQTLRARGIRGGTAYDPFTGTASVARELKRLGFRVVASDVMEYAHVFGRAYVQAAAEPRFGALADELGRDAATLKDVVAHLDGLQGEPDFVHEHFACERRYFTPENAARIDGIRGTLRRWRAHGRITEDAFYLLLAALLEAADRVANTAGVYAAYIKTWQPNATRPLRLRTPRFLASNGCRALRGDALEVVAGASEPIDLLYIDPPYNTRQYPGYYHVPELIALGWFDEVPRLRGKTGLLDDADKRSDWARRGRCEAALDALVARAPCRSILLSYNSEGIIPESRIEQILCAYGRPTSYRVYRQTGYRRYRADADRPGRRYAGDRVEERVYCVDKPD
ncbi:MAG: DNA adenine methylase [Longimicrobiales bacterium]